MRFHAEDRIIATSMRLWIALFAAGCTCLCSGVALAAMPTLEWRAPASCPDAASVRRAIQRADDPRTRSSIRHIQAEIVAVQSGYTMDLVLQTQTATHEKHLSAAQCDTLVEVLRLELGFSSLPEAPASAGGAPSQADGAPLAWGTKLTATLGTGPLPSPSPGLALALFLARAKLRVEAAFTYAFAREVRYAEAPDVGGRFDLLGGELRGCYVPFARRVAFAVCGGGELGVLRGLGVGSGVEPAFRATRAWASVFVAPALQFPIAGHVSAWAETAGFVGLLRSSYGVRSLPPLYRPDRWGFRGALGATVTFD